MNYRSFDFVPSERFYASSGSRFHPELKPSFSDKGDYELVEVSQIDTYKMIQAQRPSCDLRMIIDRFMKGDPCGDVRYRDVTYLDLSELPDSPQEWKRIEMELQNVYDAMSASDKAQYGNNFLRFLFDRFSPRSEETPVSEVDDSSVVAENNVEEGAAVDA